MVAKRAYNSSRSEGVDLLDENNEMIDVQGFLLKDCQAMSKELMEQAKLRAAELQQKLEVGKRLLLDALQEEKEILINDGAMTPQAYTISVQCMTGPYQGRMFTMEIDRQRHSSCFVGRSTGKKFRSPRGLSMPKDSELSTSHAEIKMETSGKLFLIDLDSTNGTRIENVDLEANEPYELIISKPIKVEIGAGKYEFKFEKKA
ncbi:hypothetical protein CCR75_002413 [Bremia lactucae]|uniref:FHA domain-containing protein n=1 Tax=Bremia lactucae TaxID=4779 RepID=A0A976IC85_BRELC|nr:hypothetical protein CCR75_002413 [Bremia lactucae]